MAAPIIEFRSPTAPNGVLSTITLTGSGTNGAIVVGQPSNAVTVRVYNNFVGDASIADALNCTLSSYDNTTNFGSATSTPVAQQWLQVEVANYNTVTTGADGGYVPIGGSTKHLIPVNAARINGSPLGNPPSPPSLTAGSSGSLAAGTYTVAYTYLSGTGETLISPTAQVATIGSTGSISVAAVALPPGCSGVNYYLSTAPNGATLAQAALSTTGAAMTLTALPAGGSPPVANTTGINYVELGVRVSIPAGATLLSGSQGLWVEYDYL